MIAPREPFTTNRDLYRFVADLRERGSERTLEDYLKALFVLGAADRDRDAFSLPAFASLLEAALRADVPPYDPVWERSHDVGPEPVGHAEWQQTICQQIVDLHEMERAGTLKNEYRYFGVQAPRGASWFNFDPLTFLECAVAGSFGGWQSGDETGRVLVPGKVAVMNAAGEIESVDPESIEDPIFEIEEITWHRFADFLRSGQWYE